MTGKRKISFSLNWTLEYTERITENILADVTFVIFLFFFKCIWQWVFLLFFCCFYTFHIETHLLYSFVFFLFLVSSNWWNSHKKGRKKISFSSIPLSVRGPSCYCDLSNFKEANSLRMYCAWKGNRKRVRVYFVLFVPSDFDPTTGFYILSQRVSKENQHWVKSNCIWFYSFQSVHTFNMRREREKKRENGRRRRRSKRSSRWLSQV